MAINLHEKYSSKVIERFYQDSLTESAFSKSYNAEFTGVKTVKISSIGIAEMYDYDKSRTPSRYGITADLQDTVTDYMMTQDRSFTFVIDKGDNIQQNMIKNAGKAISRQLREVVTPEIDTYRFRQWTAGAGQSAVIDTPDKDTIFSLILDGKIALDNKKVPTKNRILFVGAAAYKALLSCEEYIRLNDLGKKSIVNGQVGEILGMKVVFAPDNYLPVGVQFMIVHKGSAISPVKLHEYKIHKDPPGVSGHLAEGRFIYDAFVLEEKKDGIYVATTAA